MRDSYSRHPASTDLGAPGSGPHIEQLYGHTIDGASELAFFGKTGELPYQNAAIVHSMQAANGSRMGCNPSSAHTGSGWYLSGVLAAWVKRN